MNTLKDAWMMMKKDLKSEKKYLIWSIIFAVYMGGMLSLLISGDQETSPYLNPVADLMFLLLLPFLGFYFSRRSFKYLTDDSYTQMLAYFRTLPISNHVVLAFRILQMAFAFVLNSIFFFIILYLLADPLHQLSVDRYIAFALTWIGYGMIMTGPYIYFEFLNHGKAYFWLSMIIMVVSIVISVIIKLSGGNLLLYTIESSDRWSLLSPLMWGTFIAAAISLILFMKGMLRKLRSRDLV